VIAIMCYITIVHDDSHPLTTVHIYMY